MCDVENERGKGLTKSKVRRENFLTKYISPKNYINLALSYRMHSGKRVKSQSLR